MKFSIITVVYNAASTITRTIESVINQSYKNIEYIIIDGGSTDGTVDIINKYRENIAYFISEPDNGIYDAMNKGIRKASGDIIGILNADDWYEPNALREISSAFENCDADIIYGNINFIKDGEKSEIGKPGKLDELYTNMTVLHPATFVKCSAYKKYGLFDTKFRISGDHDLLLRMYIRGAKFKAIDTTTTNFLCTGISSTNHVMCVLEDMEVYMRYKDLCPYKNEAEEIMQNRLKLTKAIAFLEENPLKAKMLLHKLTGKESFVIWGTGSWGKWASRYLIDSDVDLNIDFFVDSNKQKWNTMFNGFLVKSPDNLQSYTGAVIIAVKNYDTEIKNQIIKIENPKINWIVLSDFITQLEECYNINNL